MFLASTLKRGIRPPKAACFLAPLFRRHLKIWCSGGEGGGGWVPASKHLPKNMEKNTLRFFGWVRPLYVSPLWTRSAVTCRCSFLPFIQQNFSFLSSRLILRLGAITAYQSLEYSNLSIYTLRISTNGRNIVGRYTLNKKRSSLRLRVVLRRLIFASFFVVAPETTKNVNLISSFWTPVYNYLINIFYIDTLKYNWNVL